MTARKTLLDDTSSFSFNDYQVKDEVIYKCFKEFKLKI